MLILTIYKKYRKEQKQVCIDQINEIFETEYSQPESHTHLQFAQSQQHKPKIAKEHVFANANSRTENNVRKHNNV